MSLLFRKQRRTATERRERLQLDLDGVVTYAVGDIHGCYDALASLERQIVEDAARFEEPKLLILLGDFIDRGRDSARVVSHLLEPPPPGFRRICLTGNHEICMLRYLDGQCPIDDWLALGGIETLYSYGLDPVHLSRLYATQEEVDAYIRDNIPVAHVEFLRSLPVMAYSREIVFVHAGIRLGVPLLDQDEGDVTSIREAFFDNADKLERWVIHGHTRVDFPRAQGKRLGIDTGAYETGRLTAFRIIGRRGRLIFS